jgi:hypothetical protein
MRPPLPVLPADELLLAAAGGRVCAAAFARQKQQSESQQQAAEIRAQRELEVECGARYVQTQGCRTERLEIIGIL